MNFIIYDLEATCWRGKPPGLVQEIIEIGAFKLNRFGEITAEFNHFVKPIVNPHLSAYCQELTSISQAQINRARTYPFVIEDFQDWIGIDEEDYLLCSWGRFDQIMLMDDCELHKLDADWISPHINLKKQYKTLRRLRHPIGLKSALEREGFDFEGTHHRGIDDAFNLTKIFGSLLDEWQY